ncbi:MAG: C-terminal helicase domain-containing protein [Isosphaeraceae bacterium]|nr:C-terminal helicase domain-containing protein [Isosphaeraceae bacterium]
MATSPVSTSRPSAFLTLRDRLSRLFFIDACKLLGPEAKSLIQQGANKWDFDLTEHVRLQKALLMCRMVADSTFLVNKEAPGFSTKLAHLEELFDRIFEEDERKVVLFSEWTTMLDLIEPMLKKRNLGYVRLDGSVPQKQRPALVHQFQTNPDCKLFLTTNAGSTGLNLQAANTVINVDPP